MRGGVCQKGSAFDSYQVTPYQVTGTLGDQLSSEHGESIGPRRLLVGPDVYPEGLHFRSSHASVGPLQTLAERDRVERGLKGGECDPLGGP
ncbi:hypothetical protein POX_g09097 [Penicillium oxalicum]|uniref:hypothetical protein n=1 Tax=Penicillium oxalicum TaxID=69781 RepID=UPI0020B8FA50|nr:hypothetical protein POX_g09097 [Penicillium oxalicum]KAI2786709.1 hypothetical protein POX_g09097 [Penicillium oxalicum]